MPEKKTQTETKAGGGGLFDLLLGGGTAAADGKVTQPAKSGGGNLLDMILGPTGQKTKEVGVKTEDEKITEEEKDAEKRYHEGLQKVLDLIAPSAVEIGFKHITIDPNVLNGQPCVRGLRIPVHLILDLLAAGKKQSEILTDYPDLTKDDIQETIEYAAWLAREESFPASA